MTNPRKQHWEGLDTRRGADGISPGGHVIIATVAPGGPTQCSGLDVVQYDADSLQRELGPRFVLDAAAEAVHRAPAAKAQVFHHLRLHRV